MSDDEAKRPRGVLMHTEPQTVVIKEDADGRPFLVIEPGMIHLRFRKRPTYIGVQETAKWLRETFEITAPRPYQPRLPQGTPEDFGHGPLN